MSKLIAKKCAESLVIPKKSVIFAVDFEKKGRYMRKWIYVLLFVLLSSPAVFAEESEALPIYDMSADRVTIYLDRLDLNGEETLMDVLQMFPDLLSNAYNDWLDGYSIRIDNGPYGGDMRVLLTQTKAIRVEKIQICDNPGVAKGITGMNGVVDLYMKPFEGVHGSVTAQMAIDRMVTPALELTVGAPSTEIIANTSYTYQPVEGNVSNHNVFSNFHMTNQLTDKDELLTYFTQSFFREPNPIDTTRTDYRYYTTQLRHHHYFDPQTMLLTAVVYNHTFAPHVRFTINEGPATSFLSSDWQGTFAACQELDKTLFGSFNIMAGWEVDYGMGDQRVVDDPSLEGPSTLDYRVMNADAYFELDYTLKNKWRFTFGDRVMFYRYRVINLLTGQFAHNDWRNMLHMSVIYTPHREHQIQAAFVRKFYNPYYLGIFREAQGMTEEEWMLAEKNIVETQLNEVKLGYGFTRPNLAVHLNTYYYNVAHSYDFFKVDASAYYRYKFFSMSGGVNVYAAKDKKYAVARLMPIFFLPYQIQIRPQVMYYTSAAPARMYNYDKPVYASLQINKQFESFMDLYIQWHDIFNGRYGMGLIGIQLKL